MNQPKVALVHDYLNQIGGAEKTLEAIMELFPNAPIYTGIYDRKKVSDKINQRTIYSSNNSWFDKFPKIFTFLMPTVFESFDLRQYDLIISDGTAWPKGVLTTPRQLHISYIHTPPRFLYKYSTESTVRNNFLFKPFVAYLDHYLRIWDFEAAQRPDFLIANSFEIQRRIKKFYNRDAQVIYPPVEVDVTTKPHTNNLKPPYYLALGRLVNYKNFNLLVQTFNLLGLPLIIAGTGSQEMQLKKMAKPNIQFVGGVSEAQKNDLYENCLGFIFPVKDEDFGLTPIEAMYHGKPVLAHRSGGVLETIKEDRDGMFFDEITVECLVKKVKEFDEAIRKHHFNSQEIKLDMQNFGFSKEKFKKEFAEFVANAWEAHSQK
ncbi:MAG TPA: glycosyltransferase [Candidatus Saccharimonadales bacterium]|nr:glycosyltransferase [Candidatus Saccharimonadales bacterium]